MFHRCSRGRTFALAAFLVAITSLVASPASAKPLRDSRKNVAPTISGDPPTTALAGVIYRFTPDAFDANDDRLTFQVSGKPAWATFDSRTGTLAGTPRLGDVGTSSRVKIKVTDGKASASLDPFVLRVDWPEATNRAPTIGGTPAPGVVAGTKYSFRPTASDPDGNKLSFSIANKPSWASFDATTGTLAGTPTAAATHSGVVISVSDGKLSASLPAFTITVTAANRAPTIGGTPATSVVAGSPYSFRPSAADADGDKLTFSIANKPSWASFDAATGTLTGTPTAAATHSGVAISVSDGKLSASLPAFTITVTAANRAPTIGGTPVTTAVASQPYAFRPSAADPDGDTLTFSIANKPSWATFDAASGTLHGTPTATGTHSGIVISVSDGKLSASLPAFTITVGAAPTKSVTLNWTAPTQNVDGSALNDLAGYTIYYGKTSRSYGTSIKVPGASANSVVIEGLTTGTWYFAIKSYTTTGLESDFSGEASATL
jgi:hypothetical protein